MAEESEEIINPPAGEQSAPSAPEPSITTSTDDFLKSLGVPTQNAHKAEAPADGTEAGTTGESAPGTDGTAPTGSPNGADGKPLGSAATKGSAKAIVGSFDFLFALGIGVYFAGIINGEKYRATPAEKLELEDALAEALVESGVVVSPWWRVMITAGAIYGIRGFAAYQEAEQIKAGKQPTHAEQVSTARQPVQNVANNLKVVRDDEAPGTAVAQILRNTNPEDIKPCKCCGGLTKNKDYCSTECRSRYVSDIRRAEKGQPHIYIGKTKPEADAIAKESAKKPAKKNQKRK